MWYIKQRAHSLARGPAATTPFISTLCILEMGPKKSARVEGRGRGKTSKAREESEERREADEATAEPSDEEEQALPPPPEGEDGSESDAGSTSSLVTGKRRDLGSYNFTAEEERTLVEFFRDHDCLYNKGSDNYANSQYKSRLLGGMARELRCDGENNLYIFCNSNNACMQCTVANITLTD